jgi:hypothetical protein
MVKLDGCHGVSSDVVARRFTELVKRSLAPRCAIRHECTTSAYAKIPQFVFSPEQRAFLVFRSKKKAAFLF